jgi:hypothetical protein
MQAARALQEALGLRSTVAVLGFALRTLAQQLEAGQLDELVAQQRAQTPDRGPAGSGRGERRGPRDEARSAGGGGGGGGNRAARANPFARPSKPVVSAPEPEPEPSAAGESPDLAEGSLESGTEPVLETPGFSVEDSAEAAPEMESFYTYTWARKPRFERPARKPEGEGAGQPRDANREGRGEGRGEGRTRAAMSLVACGSLLKGEGLSGRKWAMASGGTPRADPAEAWEAWEAWKAGCGQGAGADGRAASTGTPWTPPTPSPRSNPPAANSPRS